MTLTKSTEVGGVARTRGAARRFRIALAVIGLSAMTSALASQDTPAPNRAPNLNGLHDFDFLRGDWKAHHRV
jgi:hypothetical protein